MTLNISQDSSLYPSVTEVLAIFGYTCPKCRRAATTVHELEPRARGARTMVMQNRTAICGICHEQYHRFGASEEQVSAWKEIIRQYLITTGMWVSYRDWGKNG